MIKHATRSHGVKLLSLAPGLLLAPSSKACPASGSMIALSESALKGAARALGVIDARLAAGSAPRLTSGPVLAGVAAVPRRVVGAAFVWASDLDFACRSLCASYMFAFVMQYVCMFVCMYACMYVCYFLPATCLRSLCSMYVCMYVCVLFPWSGHIYEPFRHQYVHV